jgi:hypothetical protein
MIVASLLLAASALMTALAPTIALFNLFRIVGGVGVGLAALRMIRLATVLFAWEANAASCPGGPSSKAGKRRKPIKKRWCDSGGCVNMYSNVNLKRIL